MKKLEQLQLTPDNSDELFKTMRVRVKRYGFLKVLS